MGIKLDEILRKHKMWLNDEEGGDRANLQGADLQGEDLRGANLQGANLQGANLRWADLKGADLQGADLQGEDLRGANLQGANLRWANLRWADLKGADLQGANLQGANLQGANLQGANLDFSCLPLWHGSFHANFDDKQLIQLCYHIVKAGLNSVNASDYAKKELSKLVDFANKFHRTEECGLIDKVEGDE